MARYKQIGKQRTVHTRTDCHYYQRYFNATHLKKGVSIKEYDEKPAKCNMCDQCQRLETAGM